MPKLSIVFFMLCFCIISITKNRASPYGMKLQYCKKSPAGINQKAYVSKKKITYNTPHTIASTYQYTTPNVVLTAHDATPALKKNLAEDTAFRKAWLYSAMLPGLGQAYNKKYWKMPIIYACLGGLGWGIIYTNQKYFTFRSALAQQITTGKNDLDVNLSEDNLRHHTENLRKDRDLLIIITALIYILNIIDAHVDAHLNTFDLTKSIALKFQHKVSFCNCSLFFKQPT